MDFRSHSLNSPPDLTWEETEISFLVAIDFGFFFRVIFPFPTTSTCIPSKIDLYFSAIYLHVYLKQSIFYLLQKLLLFNSLDRNFYDFNAKTYIRRLA